MRSKIIAIKESPLTLYALITGILLSAIFYIYCVNSSVRNVVAREAIETTLTSLQNAVSELEYKYIESENGLTINRAYSYGLNELPNKIFISKTPSGKTLSLNQQ
ncbi:MAG TPA: hypothetical protein VJH67_03920 [Candidatus Paceibacterota bacterium]